MRDQRQALIFFLLQALVLCDMRSVWAMEWKGEDQRSAHQWRDTRVLHTVREERKGAFLRERSSFFHVGHCTFCFHDIFV
jgi:hypothetical protein